MFDRLAYLVSGIGSSTWVLYVSLVGLVAGVTVVLNLDTAVVFLTPVLALAARRRGLNELPFIFASFFIANAASLLLPGSNLTNLLVLAHQPLSGTAFASRMLPAWVAAVVATTAVLLVHYRRDLRERAQVSVGQRPPTTFLGAAAAVLAASAVLTLSSPAPVVLGLGVAVVALRLWQRRVNLDVTWSHLDPAVLTGLFGLAVALGTLAASWSAPGELMRSATSIESALVGGAAAVLVNNLPAAVLLSTGTPAHPFALLVGLDVGPNLAVTGSLSALLWFRAAKATGTRPSLWTVTRIGLVVVPLSMAAALLALAAAAPAGR